jgi:hypothetical protein
MVSYWCRTCNTTHDNARDCPGYIGYSTRGHPETKKLKDFQRRQRKADYGAPKGASNSVDKGCSVIALALLSIPAGLVWGVIEILHRL